MRLPVKLSIGLSVELNGKANAMVEIDSGIPLVRTAQSSVEQRPMYRILSPFQFTGWDALIQSFEAGSIFHSTAWASVLNETYGYTPLYIALRNEGRIQALLPVMEVDSTWTGKRGVALPFTDSCPLLAEDSVLGEHLFQAAISCGKQQGWRYFESRCGRAFGRNSNPSETFWEHVIPLEEEEKAFKRLKNEVRTAIRKAESEGVRVRADRTHAALNTFYQLHCRTRRRHGLPPQPLAFFQSIWRHIIRPGIGSIFLASRDNRPVAAAVFFHFGEQVIFKFGAADERFQHLRPNNLLFWEAMKGFAKRGYGSLSLGRTSVNDAGLRKFKSGWGAAEEKLHYYRYDLAKSEFCVLRDKTYGWYNRVFQQLPTSLHRLVGKLVYRHIG